jgi:hypothetical protein
MIRRGDRLYERFNNLVIVNAAMVIATTYLVRGAAKFEPGTPFLHACKQIELDVKLPVSGPLEAALANVKPDAMHIEVSARMPPEPDFNEWAAGLGRPRPSTFGLAAAAANMISPIFVEFYEAYRQYIHDKYRRAESYPTLWRFARVIRNSIAHGGFITIQSAKERPVAWYGLNYSYADNGRKIVGFVESDLTGGDLILLMFEMSDLLDQEGCPV